MEIKTVTTFVKIAEMLNFTAAAAELGYSQAAVTAQVKQLEEELGVLLFDRLGRTVALTEAGRQFLPHAYGLLRAASEAAASVQGAREIRGEIRIGASSSISSGRIPDLLYRFVERYPKVRVTVKNSDYILSLVEKIRRGELDFLYLLDEPNHYADFRIISERRDPVGFVTAADHPLAKAKNITLEQLSREAVVTSDLDSSYTLYFAGLMRRRGLPFHPALELSSVSAIVDIVKRGFGIGFIPLFAAEELLRDGTLAVLDTEDPGIEIWSQLFCHKDKWITPAMEAFIGLFEKNGNRL